MKKVKFLNGEIRHGYPYAELDEMAQEKAVNEHIDFLMETVSYEDAEEYHPNLKKAYDRAEEMQTPWFTGSYVNDFCKDDIIETMDLNDCLFDEEGDLLPLISHVNKDNKVWKRTWGHGEKEKEVSVV